MRKILILMTFFMLALLGMAAQPRAEGAAVVDYTPIAMAENALAVVGLFRMQVPCERGLRALISFRMDGDTRFGCWRIEDDSVLIDWESGDVGVIPVSRFEWVGGRPSNG